MTKIRKLVKTCERNPSQWEGELGDGIPVLIRYRYGHLTVYRSPEYDEELFSQRVTEDRRSGEMSTEDMLRITGYESEE
jgi:hypothetical protein